MKPEDLTQTNPFHIVDKYSIKSPIHNELLSLYLTGQLDDNKRNFLVLGGMAGTWTPNTAKLLEAIRNGVSLTRGQKVTLDKQFGNFGYDEKLHNPPIIVGYEYMQTRKSWDKEKLTTKLFSDTLLEIIDRYNLKRTDIVGASTGANIAMLSSKSDLVDRVGAVSPTMPFTYLADIENVGKNKLKSLHDLAVWATSNVYLNQDYGFVKDMASGFIDPQTVRELIDPQKIYAVYGDFTKPISHNLSDRFMEWFLVESAKIIRKRNTYINENVVSDGAVLTYQEYLEELGISYQISDKICHLYCDQRLSHTGTAYLGMCNLEPQKTLVKTKK